MATGTGNLPYPMSPVSPFDVITSQAENEKIANIESLADGTGIGDNAIPASKIDWQPSKFSAFANSNQSIAKGNYVVITLGSEEYDSNNEFSSSRFTANKPRSMTFSGLVTLSVSTGNMAQTVLLKNGALLKRGARIISGGTGVMALPVTADVELAAGDYVQLAVIVYHDNINTVGSLTETFLTGHEFSLG